MKVKIEIDTQTFVRFWLVVIGFAFALLAIYSARAALIIIGSALFLAIALNGPVSWLANLLPGKSRVGGTAIAYIIVVALLGMFVFMVVPPIAQQMSKFVDTVPGLIDSATTQWQGLDELIGRYHLEAQVNEGVAALQSSSAQWAANLGGNVVSGVGSFLGLLTSITLMLVLSFLMLIEGPTWLKRIWGIYNDQERMEYHKRLLGRMHKVVTAYVTGQLTVSAIGGAFAGLTVFILSFVFPEVEANLAVPAAAIYFLFSLIPMFGATISAIITVLLLVLNSVPAAIVYTIYFIIYQQIENNLIGPTIQSKAVELSALAVIAAVTVGLYVFGIAGGIISIPIAGCIKVLLEDYLERAKQNRQKSERPLNKLMKKIQEEV